MTGWPIAVDGDEYHPVPETWVNDDVSVDRSPTVPDESRLYAVAVARVAEGFRLRVRYASVDGGVATVEYDAIESDDGERYAPWPLVDNLDEWPRSLPKSRFDCEDRTRAAEEEHFETLYADRLTTDNRAIADGGGHSA